MFCYQCEETAKGEGCTKAGVCGKKGEVADLQDLLIYLMKGMSICNTKSNPFQQSLAPLFRKHGYSGQTPL